MIEIDEVGERDEVVEEAPFKAKKSSKKETKFAEEQDNPKESLGNTVTWQFKYRNYREIIDIIDPDVPATNSGKRSKVCIKARNWRLDLDLDNPKDKAIHDRLMVSKQKDSSFWMLSNIDRSKDTPASRAETLKKLMSMNMSQLLTMLTPDELEQAGIIGQPDHMQLVMAIIDSKKLV